MLQSLESLPQLVTVHGWTLRSSLQEAWFQYLVDLPPPDLPQTPPPCPILDLFTDGSCLFPADASFRVAAYAVVHAAPFHLDFTPASFKPLVACPLPGILQSAYRAELQALVTALAIVARFQSWARIWTDCSSVIRAYQKYVLDRVPVNPNSKHSDLLKQMVAHADEVSPARLAFLKVPAHADKSQYTSELDQWLLAGNRTADACAGAANIARGEAAWRLWESFAHQTTQHREEADAVRAHIVQVAKLWAAADEVTCRPSTPGVPGVTKRSARLPPLKFVLGAPVTLHGLTFRKSFGADLASAMVDWISCIRSDVAEIRWISYMHLYISFQWKVGPIAVTRRNGSWSVSRGSCAGLANHIRLGTRIKWFRLMCQQFLKDAKAEYVTSTTRPYSQWICCFRGCIGFPMAHSEFVLVEEFLQKSLGSPATGQGKSLDAVHI